MRAICLCLLVFALPVANAFRPVNNLSRFQSSAVCRGNINHKNGGLKMLFEDIELNTYTYAAIFAVTMIPSLIFVKFVGDQADASKEKLSDKQRKAFKKAMMEQPGANIALPSSEEEALQKAIAKAYIQDKDVDVAVLEEKLKLRAQWRKEILAQQKEVSSTTEDEDGW